MTKRINQTGSDHQSEQTDETNRLLGNIGSDIALIERSLTELVDCMRSIRDHLKDISEGDSLMKSRRSLDE
jgi:hypothetical protein